MKNNCSKDAQKTTDKQFNEMKKTIQEENYKFKKIKKK